MKILITDATDDQLREFAASTLFIDADMLGLATDRSELLALIGPSWPNDFINVADAIPPAAQTGQVEPVEVKADVTMADHLVEEFGPLTTFKIISTNMPGGNHPAHPCVNNRQLVMQRNMLIRAPYAFYLALLNAKVGDTYEIDNGQGKAPSIGVADVTNYPLTDVILPPKEVIEEWHQRRGAIPLAA